MNTEIVKYERIQEYLRGKMSDEDRVAFERDLATDDTLRQQCEDLSLLARSIKKANQEVDLRKALAETEQQIAEAQEASLNNPSLKADLDQVERELRMMGVPVEEPKVSSSHAIFNIIKKTFKSIGQWFAMRGPWSVEISDRSPATVVLSRVYGVAARVAVVGCFSIVCMVGALSYNAQKVGYGYQFPIGIKGTTEIEALMENNKNKEAIIQIEEARKWLEEQKNNPMYDDQVYLNDLNIQEQELDFLEAVCQLRRWHYFSGKNALKKIADSGGVYAKEARDLLEQL